MSTGVLQPAGLLQQTWLGREPTTRPWFGLRRDGSTFEIFEAFPDEAGREAHLTGKGAALLMERSNAVLAKPAQIVRLDVLMRKGEAAIDTARGPGVRSS